MDKYEYMCLSQWIYLQAFIDENYIEHLFINKKYFPKIAKACMSAHKHDYLPILKS